MLFVVARISIITTDVHDLAINADNLRMRVQIIAFLVVTGPGPLEMEQGIEDAINLLVRDASIPRWQNLHDDLETFLDFVDRGLIFPRVFGSVDFVCRHDNIDSLRIRLEVWEAGMKIGRF